MKWKKQIHTMYMSHFCDIVRACIMIWYAYCSTEDRNGPPNALLLDHQLHPAPWKPLFSVRLPVRLEKNTFAFQAGFPRRINKTVCVPIFWIRKTGVYRNLLDFQARTFSNIFGHHVVSLMFSKIANFASL